MGAYCNIRGEIILVWKIVVDTKGFGWLCRFAFHSIRRIFPKRQTLFLCIAITWKMWLKTCNSRPGAFLFSPTSSIIVQLLQWSESCNNRADFHDNCTKARQWPPCKCSSRTPLRCATIRQVRGIVVCGYITPRVHTVRACHMFYWRILGPGILDIFISPCNYGGGVSFFGCSARDVRLSRRVRGGPRAPRDTMPLLSFNRAPRRAVLCYRAHLLEGVDCTFRERTGSDNAN